MVFVIYLCLKSFPFLVRRLFHCWQYRIFITKALCLHSFFGKWWEMRTTLFIVFENNIFTMPSLSICIPTLEYRFFFFFACSMYILLCLLKRAKENVIRFLCFQETNNEFYYLYISSNFPSSCVPSDKSSLRFHPHLQGTKQKILTVWQK